MQMIRLKKMTRELCHELYKHWSNDASIYADLSGINKVYTYIEAQADRCFESKNEWLQLMQIPLGGRFKLVAMRANVRHSFFPTYSYPNEAETKADIQQTL